MYQIYFRYANIDWQKAGWEARCANESVKTVDDWRKTHPDFGYFEFKLEPV